MVGDRENEGFTLIELLVVIVIVGVLMAIAIPMYLNQAEKARVSSVEVATHQIAVGLQCYANDHGDVYPGPLDVVYDVRGDLYPGFMDGWPENGWTKADVDTTSEAEGDVTYMRISTGFSLIGHGSGGDPVSTRP